MIDNEQHWSGSQQLSRWRRGGIGEQHDSSGRVPHSV